jgi:hypothetical protein
MNRDWLTENFLVPRSRQNRERIPNPVTLQQLLSQFTTLRFTSERLVRCWLEEPQRYDQYNHYDDTEDRLRRLINGPPCAYCMDIPLAPLQGLYCTHQTSICTDCLMLYFKNLKITKPCGRRFEDGTVCEEPTIFRIAALNPLRGVHQTAELSCAHGFVFRFSECKTLEFRCFFPGCQKLCRLDSMHPPPLLEPDSPLALD